MWHMRGGVTREEAWTLSFIERQDIMEDIETRMKTAKETQMPVI